MSDFTIRHYKNTLEKYKDEGYVFRDAITPWDGGAGLPLADSCKIIVLVHDVDHDISLCSNFLDAEKELGVISTYFLRLHARQYNMLSPASIEIAKKILNAGQQIGLHYEPSFCPQNASHEEHVNSELKILSNILGKEIKCFNIHEPVRTGIDIKDLIPEKNRCPNSSTFRDFKYLSDSSCRWREGCFSLHLNKWKKLLVCTHPLWWYKNSPTENY
mgnify:FL=1